MERQHALALKIPPPVVGLVATILIYALAQLWPQWNFDFPFQNVLAIVLGATGLAFDGAAIAAFFAVRTTVNPMAPGSTSSLVTSGLYRVTRNPMYLGLLLILSGVAVYIGNPLALTVIAGFIAYITRFQIMPEEALLRQKFGADYTLYCARVRRWL